MPLKYDDEVSTAAQYDKNGVKVYRNEGCEDWDTIAERYRSVRKASFKQVWDWARGTKLPDGTKGCRASRLKVLFMDSGMDFSVIEAWLPGRFPLYDLWRKSNGY